MSDSPSVPKYFSARNFSSHVGPSFPFLWGATYCPIRLAGRMPGLDVVLSFLEMVQWGSREEALSEDRDRPGAWG